MITKKEFVKNVCESCENLYTCDNNYYEGKIEDCMKEYEYYENKKNMEKNIE